MESRKIFQNFQVGLSVLFDAGEAVQKQFILYSIKPFKIEYIIISHLHPDHFIGLIGLLCSWSLMGRWQKLIIVSPYKLQEIIDLQLNTAGIALRYKIEYIVPIAQDDVLVLATEHFYLKSYLMKHRITCFGYKLIEKEHQRRLLPQKLVNLNLPYDAYPILKAGKDFTNTEGILFSYKDLTEQAHHQRSFTYFTDTIVQMQLAKYVGNTDLLYHDATFLNDMQEKANETGHSTCREAAEFAQEAGVKKLLLGHFSSRYRNLKILEQEARTIFAESYLATEGEFFEVNLQ